MHPPPRTTMVVLNKTYEQAKAALLADESICSPNRELFRRFFEFEEYKLKRINRLSALDDGCYKTLYNYVLKFRVVNRWFSNKPWVELTKEDITRVYDDLEDGKLTTLKGTRFVDRATYYNKVLKSKPFKMAGKADL